MSPEVEVMQVIRTSLLRRGKGEAPNDPARIIEQFWTMDGQLIFEIDAWAEQHKRETNK